MVKRDQVTGTDTEKAGTTCQTVPGLLSVVISVPAGRKREKAADKRNRSGLKRGPLRVRGDRNGRRAGGQVTRKMKSSESSCIHEGASEAPDRCVLGR